MSQDRLRSDLISFRSCQRLLHRRSILSSTTNKYGADEYPPDDGEIIVVRLLEDIFGPGFIIESRGISSKLPSPTYYSNHHAVVLRTGLKVATGPPFFGRSSHANLLFLRPSFGSTPPSRRLSTAACPRPIRAGAYSHASASCFPDASGVRRPSSNW